jgi:hypothetical protein
MHPPSMGKWHLQLKKEKGKKKRIPQRKKPPKIQYITFGRDKP